MCEVHMDMSIIKQALFLELKSIRREKEWNISDQSIENAAERLAETLSERVFKKEKEIEQNKRY